VTLLQEKFVAGGFGCMGAYHYSLRQAFKEKAMSGDGRKQPMFTFEEKATPFVERPQARPASPKGPDLSPSRRPTPKTDQVTASKGTSTARPQSPVVRIAPVTQTTVYQTFRNSRGGSDWWRRIPARLWMAAVAISVPFRAIAMILDALVAASVLVVIFIGWAWWTRIITDDQVAHILAQLGGRGISILQKSGIL
jgi:hypothetical protein